jgi:hypothetical protein
MTLQVASKEVKAAQNLILRDDLKYMQRVLRRLGYVKSDGMIDEKGKVVHLCDV